MAVGSIGSNPNAMVQALIDMRAQFDDLSRQLSTGQKSATYAGLGLGSGLSVSLNAQLSAIGGYDNSIDMASTRIDLAQNALGAMAKIGSSMQTMLAGGGAGNTSVAQSTAQSSLQQLLGLLNTQAGDRYLFSGRATDQPSVETLRSHPQRRRRPRRPQAGHRRAQAGRSRRQRPRAACRRRADRDLGVARRGRGLAVRLQARWGQLDAERRHGKRPERLAGVAVGRSRAANPNDGETLTVCFTLPDGSSAEPHADGDHAGAARRRPVRHRRHAGRDRRQSADRPHPGARQAGRTPSWWRHLRSPPATISSTPTPATRPSASPDRRSTPHRRWSPAPPPTRVNWYTGEAGSTIGALHRHCAHRSSR